MSRSGYRLHWCKAQSGVRYIGVSIEVYVSEAPVHHVRVGVRVGDDSTQHLGDHERPITRVPQDRHVPGVRVWWVVDDVSGIGGG